MYLTKKERDELSSLSREVFGRAGIWQKLIKDGYNEPALTDIVEQVPQEDGTTKEETKQIRKLNEHGQPYSTLKFHTAESVKELMLARKAQIDEFMAKIKEQQEKAKADQQTKLLADAIHQDAQGSAT